MTPGGRHAGVLVSASLHALAGAVLLSQEPARTALLAAAPLVVELLAPAQPAPRAIAPDAVPATRPTPRLPPPAEPPQPRAAPVSAPLVPVPPPPAVASKASMPAPPTIAAPVAVAAAPAPAAPPAVVVTPPVFDADYLRNPAPAYPALSRRIGEEGRVVLRVRVGATGAAEDVQVHGSSGHARLDNAARESVQRWRFVPARRGEDPVAAWVLVPISFKLEGREG